MSGNLVRGLPLAVYGRQQRRRLKYGSSGLGQDNLGSHKECFEAGKERI